MPLGAASAPAADLPPDLAGPVAVALTRAVERIPPESALSGGCWYEPKWDGFRLVVSRSLTGTTLWLRRGRDLTARFPDLAAAARAQLTPGVVVDGEAVAWHDDRLDFALLQRRMITAVTRVGVLRPRIRRRSSPSTSSPPAARTCARCGCGSGARSWRTLATRWEAAGWLPSYRVAGVEGRVVKGARSGARGLP